jgi:hypothetical protein
VASIALKGQASKICGTSDHLNVNFCPNQALAELAQVMFDQFSAPDDHRDICTHNSSTQCSTHVHPDTNAGIHHCDLSGIVPYEHSSMANQMWLGQVQRL